MKIINFIQDEATPHNNLLLKALNDTVELDLWYATDQSKNYTWKSDLTNAIKQAYVYGNKGVSWRLIRRVLFKKNHKFFLVGWSNPTTKVLLLLFFLLKKDFSIWFDHPQDSKNRGMLKHLFREFFYLILKYSKGKVFCVGENTISYFCRRGFEMEKLINLPVFVSLEKYKEDYFHDKDIYKKKYSIDDEILLITSGSRLVKEKGFDLLIKSIELVTNQNRVKLVIFGQGEEEQNLRKQISDCKLEDIIYLEPWMDINEMKSLISCSDLFIHPARWDAFGGGTLNAMSLGVPVIASNQSGSGPDRITHGENGWLYEASDYKKLAGYINSCCENREVLKLMGIKARKEAEKWSVSYGCEIIKGNIL